MKVVFTALHFAYFRNFEPVVRALAETGHDVHLVADEAETFGGQALVARLADEYPSVTWSFAPTATREPWFPFAQKVRYALDYVRFLDPRYHDVPKLRLRNIERTPRVVRWLAALAGHRFAVATLRWLERSMPRSAAVQSWLEEQAPDVVLLTSLTFSRSSAMEQLKAARALGVPTAACIMSWDHLSSKALLHIAPDTTIVWNGVQKAEAVEMHGLPADRVVVTGAQCYDQWFERQPSRSRERFCRAVGLDPGRPFILYVCSTMSPVPTPVEPVFVRRWIEALRTSGDPALREASVLVRPHPERMKEWTGVSLEGLEHVAVHGGTPIDSDSKADYFDSLFYSGAVVGLCTSAFLEAAIVGRPVLTLLLPEYRMHQDGMAHFRYLQNVAGGVLHCAVDLDSHLQQLSHAVRSSGREEQNRRFLTAFIRPDGLDAPATPRFVEAVEALSRMPRIADRRFVERRAGQGVVARLAALSTHGIGRWLMMDAIDDRRDDSERRRSRVKEGIAGERDDYFRRKAAARVAQRREREHQQRAKAWAKWRRGLNARKQMARLKGGLKQLTGARGR